MEAATIPLNPSARRERKSFVLGTTDALGKFLILGTGASATTAASALALFRQSTAVSVPINMIADPFSCIGISLQIGKDLVREHPVLDFLKQPSAFHDQELLLNVLAKDYLVTGEAMFILLGRINAEPLGLIPISPSVASATVTGDSDAPNSWFVAGSTLKGMYVARPNIFAPNVRYISEDSNLRELFLIRNYSTRNNSMLRGESLLIAASREARSHILGTEHNVSILENGGRVSLEFHFEEDMDDDDYQAIVSNIEQKYVGASNAGGVVVTAGGKLEITELGATPRDMDFSTLQGVSKKAIAMQYKVPLPLISDERQTLNNYAIGNLALYDQAVLPLANRILGALSRALLPRYGLDPKTARLIADQDTVTALVIRRNEELNKRKVTGIETINELRASLGREGIQGGDVLYQNAAMVPVGTDLFNDDNDPDNLEPVLGGASDAPDTETEISTPLETEEPDEADAEDEAEE